MPPRGCAPSLASVFFIGSDCSAALVGGVELGDDRGRRVLRRQQRGPGAGRDDGKPLSTMVGTSGSSATRFGPDDRERAQLAVLDQRQRGGDGIEGHLHFARDHAVSAGPPPL